jgi:hypothetical protein
LREVHIFNLIGSNNSNSQNLCNYSNEQLQILTEKQALIIEQQNKEIVYLKEIIELLKRDKI